MAKKDEKKKKDSDRYIKESSKNRYSRKPSTVSGTALKQVAKVAREAVDAGKRMSYKGKMSKTAKDILVLKSVTDPADKAAIKAARSIKGKKALLESKAGQNSIIRNMKNQGKRASKESQKAYNARAMKAQASQDLQKMRDKNAITKSRIKQARAAREEAKAIPPIPKKKAAPAINERRLPSKDTPALKPVTAKNIKAKEGVPPVIERKGKITQTAKPKRKLTKGEKIAGGAIAAGGATLLLNKDKKKSVESKSATISSEVKPNSSKSKSNIGEVKTPTKAISKVSRNEFNKKVKPEVKKPEGKAPSVSEALNKALSNPKLKNKTIAPKVKQEALAKARAYIAKNKKSNVPWEKILESITMMMSSYILSRGISKRYK